MREVSDHTSFGGRWRWLVDRSLWEVMNEEAEGGRANPVRRANRAKENEADYSLYGRNIAIGAQPMTLRIVLLVGLKNTSPWMTDIYTPCLCFANDAAEASQFVLIGNCIAKDEYGLVL